MTSPRTRRRSAFSLVEIMVVIAIGGILLALGAPLLNDRGSAINKAGKVLSDLAALARENALAKSAPTALVFTLSRSGSQAATLIQMDAERNWTQITPWTVLPSSVAVKNDSAFALPALPSGGGDPVLKLVGKPIDLASETVAYLFDTDGRLSVNAATPAQIRVTAVSGSSPDYYEIIINANTGTCKIVRP